VVGEEGEMSADADIQEVTGAYIAAWDSADAGVRRRHLERALTDDAAIAYPSLHCSGYDAIADHIGEVHEQIPGVRVRQRSGIQWHHGWLRVAWRMVHADGATLLDGVDFAEVADDGRLRRVVGFHDPLPDTLPG
jgi:hypothetical protein